MFTYLTTLREVEQLYYCVTLYYKTIVCNSDHALLLLFPEKIDAPLFAIVFPLHYIQLPCDSEVKRRINHLTT